MRKRSILACIRLSAIRWDRWSLAAAFLNKRLNRNNDGGTTRRTTDVFQLATTVSLPESGSELCTGSQQSERCSGCLHGLYESGCPQRGMRHGFVDGYPGKYVVLARRHGDTWYLAAVNAGKEPLKLKLDLEMFAGKTVALYKDDKKGEPELNVAESEGKR